MPLKEQQAVHTLRAHRTNQQSTSQHRVGTPNGIHPEDRPHLTDERRPTNRQPVYDDGDDALYNTRMPTSARRYAAPTTTPPRTVMRVTTHQGPPPKQRAHIQAPAYQEPEQTSVQQGKWRVHFLCYVGLALVCMVMGWWCLSSLYQWWQVQQDTLHYGMPRTFQIDRDVRHGGISHFTVENLNGHILIYEVVPTDITKPHLYIGPVFAGAGTELQPATISFEDVNGDSYPDLVIAVSTGRYLLINDHSAFRPVNSSDHISGKGV